jgi:hypothetical protein
MKNVLLIRHDLYGCIWADDYRFSDQQNSDNMRTFYTKDDIVSEARVGHSYKLEYMVGSGGGHEIHIRRWRCFVYFEEGQEYVSYSLDPNKKKRVNGASEDADVKSNSAVVEEKLLSSPEYKYSLSPMHDCDEPDEASVPFPVQEFFDPVSGSDEKETGLEFGDRCDSISNIIDDKSNDDDRDGTSTAAPSVVRVVRQKSIDHFHQAW